VDVLIKAFQLKRDDICLLIIGDGKLRPYFEKLYKQLKLRNVYFFGRIPGTNFLHTTDYAKSSSTYGS
jgi:glycosyltransferase involved in cell wall biosynthesis